MLRKPYSAEFYEEGHDSDALEITAQIAESFNDLAKYRGKMPIVIIFPDLDDISYYKKNGMWIFQNLIDRLNTKNIVVFNVGDGLLEYARKAHIEELFLTEPTARGHYNETGNRVIAEIIYNYLKSKRLL